MNLQQLITWGNPPEYILEGFWFLEILDDLSHNTIKLDSYLSGNNLDDYIEEINIPQLSLSYEKTDFDMLNFEEKEPFDSITLTFYDDTKGSCLNFFQDWLNSIYDKKKNCIKNNWRYERKNLVATMIKIYKEKDSISDTLLKTTLSGAYSVVEGIPTIFGESIKPELQGIQVNTIAEYSLMHCLPIKINEISLSASGGGRMSFSVELECEQVDVLYGDNTKGRYS